jgi:EAL domain-containing protein (putative c-di-GMP-specific phosphodiesterase class I)/FixJ family two-component response regulator
MKILALDDDSFALGVLTRQLARAGHEDVATYDDAGRALGALATTGHGIDLVFCDLQMPGMDGVEFVRHLVALGYAGGLVLVSGEERRIVQSVERLAAGHRLRILGALSKPVRRGELEAVLERAGQSAEPARPEGPEPFSAAEVRSALAGRQLINHYQPKVELASGALVGVEALVRWQHPRLGLVYPDRFIAMAEEHDLIGELTVTVLRTALGQLGRWSAEGLQLNMAVNVSMDNLGALDFPDLVEREAQAAGVKPARLVLEVTESRLMTAPLSSLDILTRLRLKHIGLAIDDFGTGHSSLSQLRDIPFDELKVDRGFIHGAHADGSLQAIVEASVGMARQMGIRTVAEGIEDIDDWRYVRQAGVDVAQGYFIAKPMAAAQIPAWAVAWNRGFERLLRA